MIIVSITFLGEKGKIELVGRPLNESRIYQHEDIRKLEPDGDSLILGKHEEKYQDIWDWCVENCDFKNNLEKRAVNFVFND